MAALIDTRLVILGPMPGSVGTLIVDDSTLTVALADDPGGVGVRVGTRGSGLLEVDHGGNVEINRDPNDVSDLPTSITAGFLETAIGTINLRNRSSITATGGLEALNIQHCAEHSGTLNILGESDLTLENLDGQALGLVGRQPGHPVAGN